jgi:iron complex transport system substrate-binding protein
MRIVSLLPAATEILYAVGAGDAVVGVSHECDFPPEAKRKPALIRPRVNPLLPQGEIDRQVRELVAAGQSLYAVDVEQLIALEPDLIVTQDLCHVCAASPEDLAAALARLSPQRSSQVLTFTPHSIADVCDGISRIGEAAGRPDAARRLASDLAEAAAEVERAAAEIVYRPGVLCLEWFDPPFVAGHWVPEMVRLTGGRDLFGREGEASFQVSWQQILDAQPEVVVLMPCGYGVEGTLAAWSETRRPRGWDNLSAAKTGRVHAVDANAYLSRPGPRLAEGLRLLARLLHKENQSLGARA